MLNVIFQVWVHTRVPRSVRFCTPLVISNGVGFFLTPFSIHRSDRRRVRRLVRT